MNFRNLAFRLAVLCVAFLAPSPASFGDTLDSAQEITLEFDFQNGSSGWLPGYADYDLVTRGIEFLAEVRPLPEELDTSRRAFYIQGMNRSDDLFMYFKRELTEKDGLRLNTAYRVSFHVRLASNAATGAVGIGGAPGESVHLKAGLTVSEPVTSLTGSFVEMANLDKGYQANDGKDAVILGDVTNGTDSFTYALIERARDLPAVVRTNDDGVLWAIVGTDSGFEGLTGLYYERITIKLTPVIEMQSQNVGPTGL